jgi:hypothetical protein
MPTKRKPISRGRSTVPAGVWHFLLGDEFDPDQHAEGRLQTFLVPRTELWLRHRAEVVAWCALNRPGWRPPLFWEFEVGADMPATPTAQRRYLERLGLLLDGER